MHLSHEHSRHRLQAKRPQAVFPLGGCALRHPHIARHTRVPSFFGPRRHFAARVRALFVRIHTFYLKFLQGHT
ncbi:MULTISPECIES: hypothetical protein [Delftia]|jgi:hypothetical protein|uniref:Uncharacterized protein n=2 Tax=Delftia TaxID=80865 RepID=A0AAX3SS12_9BURK|nr:MULTISPECIES: hypothetical protein [Delftia]KAA9168377.1 hypothetical protein F3K36_22090 [Delftia sp. BR1]KEH13324.1 hypothetical protein GY15_13735 [Delftia sp. 670]AOV02246.1 hypothetical protein BI380_13340 [Delftia tsuruhatensis]EPD37184.1 hypothetical protein HMPREF9701_04397 [Delftia acidovorans CCUG 274B]EPD42200.1 hypothetical protein HMPREF9702_02879 [Delftia acidovorans CCUG 15835]